MFAFQSSVMVRRHLHQKSFPLLTSYNPCTHSQGHAEVDRFKPLGLGFQKGYVTIFLGTTSKYLDIHTGGNKQKACVSKCVSSHFFLCRAGVHSLPTLSRKNLFKCWRIYDSSSRPSPGQITLVSLTSAEHSGMP